MPIIRIGDNQKNKWKRNAQTTKKEAKAEKSMEKQWQCES